MLILDLNEIKEGDSTMSFGREFQTLTTIPLSEHLNGSVCSRALKSRVDVLSTRMKNIFFE